MPDQTIPRAEFGICGGSGIAELRLPRRPERPARRRCSPTDLVFDTPFGRSPAFTHFRVDGSRGPARGARRQDARLAPRREARRRVAAGVLGLPRGRREQGPRRRRRRSLNHLLDPRDVVIPNDFIDLTDQAGHLRPRRPPAHHAPADLPRPGRPRSTRAPGSRLPARLPARHLPRHRRPALRVAGRGRLHEAPRRRRHRAVARRPRSSSRATSARASPASTWS